ncbi:hypothetical protein D9M68_773770 [compost metagenome]
MAQAQSNTYSPYEWLFRYIGQAACSSSPRHRVMNCACQPACSRAQPLSCSAVRYAWRMKGLGSVSSASRWFQAAAGMAVGEARTRVT